MRLALAIALLALLGLSGCATNPATGTPDLMLVSQADEIRAGDSMQSQVIDHFGHYEAAALQDYVAQVGQRIASHAPRADLKYHFEILDSAEVNAFALPGGHIYITRGLLAYLNSEPQLAAVLSHEVGHVVARHAARQASQGMVVGLVGAAVSIYTGIGATGDLVNGLGNVALRGYGRGYELEADRLGAEYLARSGYDPNAMIEVLNILKNQEEFEIATAKQENRAPNVYHGVFSTHPDTDERLKEVIRAASKLKSMPVPPIADTATFMHKLDGLVLIADINKRTKSQRYIDPNWGIAVQAPENWSVTAHDQQHIEMQIGGGSAAITLQSVDWDGHMSARDLLINKVGAESVEKTEALHHGTLQGFKTMGIVNTPFGHQRARLIVILHEHRAYVFIGAARDAADVEQYHLVAIDQSALSLHLLTPQEIADARERRLHIIVADANARYAQLATQSKLDKDATARLRLLNGAYPDKEPGAGQFVKVVQ